MHYTPKHGSWLNQAEIELSLISRQCLGKRRIPTAQNGYSLRPEHGRKRPITSVCVSGGTSREKTRAARSSATKGILLSGRRPSLRMMQALAEKPTARASVEALLQGAVESFCKPGLLRGTHACAGRNEQHAG